MQIIDKTLNTTTSDNIPKFLIVHHTGGDMDTSNQTFEIVRDYHLSLGWDTIGYHYFIDKKGIITQGRKDNYHGAHTTEQNMNKSSLGICLAGNFDMTFPTIAQVDSLKALLNAKTAQYGIKSENIYPHRHYALNLNGTPYKSCYGNKLSDSWARDLVTSVPVDKPAIKAQIKNLVDLL